MDATIVGIRFQKIGKIYHFDAGSFPDLKVGDFVVVDTARGRQLGEVAQIVTDPPPPPEGVWKPIQRRASPRDLVLRRLWQKKEVEAMINCRARLAELNLPGVKVVAAEITFDGGRLSFLYSTETEAKVDLRRLQSAMQRLYPKPRVEMRLIGPRDVAKYLGGMGACGLENRCCSMFLTEFSPISIKMAKEQGISLTPTEITGMCGRLRCCLIYEYEQYVEARKSLPKRSKRVITPQGEGKVWDIYPLRHSVLVELDSGTRTEFSADDLQPWDELEALRRKAQAPCDRHENGECNCGKSEAVGPAAEHSDDAPDYGGEVIDLDSAAPPDRPAPSRPSRPVTRQHNRPGEAGRPRSDRDSGGGKERTSPDRSPSERAGSPGEPARRPNRDRPDSERRNRGAPQKHRSEGGPPDTRRPDSGRRDSAHPDTSHPEGGRPPGGASSPSQPSRRNKPPRKNRGGGNPTR
jgi:cell fate regulator YaaT (PSP1 superfamily)